MLLINLLTPFVKAVMTFVCILMLASIMIWLLNPVIIPILVSLVLYVCLSPLHDWLTNLGWRADVSALAILLFILFMLLVPGALMLGVFSEQMNFWQTKASTVGVSLNQILEEVSGQLEKWQIYIEVGQLKQNVLSVLTRENNSLLASLSGVVLSISSSLLLVPFITFFLLRDLESLRNRLLQMLPNKNFELGWIIYSKVANQIQGYVRAVLIQQGVLALVSATGFWLVGFDSPLILGLTVGVLGLIPYVGPALGLIPPFYLVLAVQPINYDAMLAAVAVVAVAYVIDNLFVIPLVVAKFANLHPLVALLGIIIFGNFFGIMGMIAAIPIMAISNIIFSQLHLSFDPKKFKAVTS